MITPDGLVILEFSKSAMEKLERLKSISDPVEFALDFRLDAFES